MVSSRSDEWQNTFLLEDFDLDFAGTTSFSGISTLPAAQTGTGTSPPLISAAAAQCRRKDEPQMEHMPQPKKPRLVFTDLQRRTLQAIFKVSYICLMNAKFFFTLLFLLRKPKGHQRKCRSP